MKAFQELILFIISILPVYLIGLYVYKKDKQKEPTKLLVKLFLGGMGSCFLVLLVTYILSLVFPIIAADPKSLGLIELVIHVFVGVALIEEVCKWFMVYKISYHDEAFDEFYDAILYCVFVALGFACFENLAYVSDGGIATGIVRALSAVPGHACDGMLMGYYLGLSKISEINNRKDLKRKKVSKVTWLLLHHTLPCVRAGLCRPLLHPLRQQLPQLQAPSPTQNSDFSHSSIFK